MFRVIYDDGIESTLDDGGESVYVQGNNDTLQGGLGADWISTVLRGQEPDGLSTVLSGSQGSDTLHAVLTLDGEGYDNSDQIGKLTATLSGGPGNDEIEIHTAALSANQTVAVTGGKGEDTITVDVDVRDPTHAYATMSTSMVDVDGGAGADRIAISVVGGDLSGTDVSGGDGDDRIEAFSNASADAGGNGNTIYGDAGNDTIIARSSSSGDYGTGTNHAWGGTGNDSLDLSSSGASADNRGSGDGGDDMLRLDASAFRSASNFAEGGGGNDTLRLVARSASWNDGGEASNEAHGGDGKDVISAVMDLPEGNNSDGETEMPFSGHNVVHGDAGNDRLSARIDTPDPSGGNFFSELYGGSGDDRLSVRGGEGNILNGGTGDDTLLGGSGADTLIGLGGDDYLRGRGGDDVFLFGYIRNGEQDRIVDFTIGEDKIDLSQIDANRDRGGEQSFRFGTREGTGRVWVEDSKGSSSILHADDGHRVLEVVLQDGRGVDAGDYSASDFLL